jgi:DNA-binding response OmpR family regulator
VPLKLLLIEDERQLSEALMTLFRRQKYAVDAVYDGQSGEDSALTGIYDVIILDIMLPKKSGIEVLRSIRDAGIAAPVLLLTAKSEIYDKIDGLDNGADDYLTKPFAAGELLARIRALSRRKGEIIGDEITVGNTTLRKTTHGLACAGQSVVLSQKEYLIMETLAQNGGQIISKERLMEKVWGFESEAEYNAIEVYISFIRRKLEALKSDIRIRAARGAGYILEVGP